MLRSFRTVGGQKRREREREKQTKKKKNDLGEEICFIHYVM